VLEQSALDLRAAPLEIADPVFFVGVHLGLDEAARAAIAALGATPISVGPIAVHAEDAITIAANELDRRSGLVAS
jgi:tRNA (pseudouridine54-N1)-methyltransferase